MVDAFLYIKFQIFPEKIKKKNFAFKIMNQFKALSLDTDILIFPDFSRFFCKEINFHEFTFLFIFTNV